MFRRSWTDRVKNALGASEFALHLAQDKKFRKRLLSAVEHSTEAWRRARHGSGFAGAARRLAADQTLKAELRDARRDLQQAYARLNAKRRGHRLRRISLAGLASLAAVPQVRERVSALIATALGRAEARPRTLEDLTKEALYARAQEADIPGRSEMSKEELVAALRAKA